MPDSRLLPDWDLDDADGRAGLFTAAAVLAGGALVAAAFPPLAGVAGMPFLALGAVWVHERATRGATRARVEEFLATLEARDRYTASHCSRVAVFADLIAEEIGLSDPGRLRNLRVAALLHDLGKLDVPLAILHKPGKLDDEEWAAMRTHVERGTDRASCLAEAVCRIIAEHHERPDGRGYPRKLRGDAICLEARIVAVADAFDAMTSNRPYRRARDPRWAMDELRRSAGSRPGGEQFDPTVVEAFARRFAEVAALCTAESATHASPLG